MEGLITAFGVFSFGCGIAVGLLLSTMEIFRPKEKDDAESN